MRVQDTCHPQRGKLQIAFMLLSGGRSCLQVDETVGFADDEDPSDGLVSDRRDEGLYLDEPEGAVSAEGLPKVTSANICPRGDSCRCLPLAQHVNMHRHRLSRLRKRVWLRVKQAHDVTSAGCEGSGVC